jgi:transcription elongation factor GreA
MAEVAYFTQEGLENLKKELIALRTKGRADMAKQIQEAREKGDLSENAEYDAAKEAQGLLEMRISQLETILSHARILDSTKVDNSKVNVLSKVRVKNHNIKKEIIYTLVSEKEAELKTGKISVTSPIGKALLGRSVKEIVEVTVPSGVMKLEILEINL